MLFVPVDLILTLALSSWKREMDEGWINAYPESNVCYGHQHIPVGLEWYLMMNLVSERLPKTLWRGLMVVALLTMLGGCAAAVVGGAATGMAVIHDRRTAATMLEDQVIEVKANERMSRLIEGFNEAHISVTSYNGLVLLSGEATSREMSAASERVAREVEKVRRVYNELQVGPVASARARAEDSLVTIRVKYALTTMPDHSETDFAHIKVVTERGIVYLMGLVSRRDGDHVVERARRVRGVSRVVKLFEYVDRDGT